MPTYNKDADKGGQAAPQFVSNANTGITLQSMAAWAFLFVGLVILSDIPMLGDIAAAFALLILISVLMGFGPAAFDNISKLFSEG